MKKDESKKNTIDGDGGVITPTGGYVPYAGDADAAHNELLNNPQYAVHVHESQIKRIIELIEELSARMVALEDKFLDLDLNVRFKTDASKNDGPPEPPVV